MSNIPVNLRELILLSTLYFIRMSCVFPFKSSSETENTIKKKNSRTKGIWIPCATVRSIIVEFQWKTFSKPTRALQIFRHVLLLPLQILYFMCYRSKSDDVKSGSLPSCTCFEARFRSDRNHALSTDASSVHRCCACRAWRPSPSTERQRWVWKLRWYGDVSRR